MLSILQKNLISTSKTRNVLFVFIKISFHSNNNLFRVYPKSEETLNQLILRLPRERRWKAISVKSVSLIGGQRADENGKYFPGSYCQREGQNCNVWQSNHFWAFSTFNNEKSLSDSFLFSFLKNCSFHRSTGRKQNYKYNKWNFASAIFSFSQQRNSGE